jgi:hypothetical protein
MQTIDQATDEETEPPSADQLTAVRARHPGPPGRGHRSNRRPSRCYDGAGRRQEAACRRPMGRPLPLAEVVPVSGWDLAIAESHDGETIAFVPPHVPNDAPDAVREGIARRRITAVDGECPCGARLVLPNRAERRKAARTGQATRITGEHEDDCAVVDAALVAAVKAWKR